MLATMPLTAGSYVITGKTALRNLWINTYTAACELWGGSPTGGGFGELDYDWATVPAKAPGQAAAFQPIAFTGAVTVVGTGGSVNIRCWIVNGDSGGTSTLSAFSSNITAVQVAALH